MGAPLPFGRAGTESRGIARDGIGFSLAIPRMVPHICGRGADYASARFLF
jgi:hypothetical protein